MKLNIVNPKITSDKINEYSKEKLNEFKSKVDKTWSEAHAVYMEYNDKYMACVGSAVIATISLTLLFSIALVSLISQDKSSIVLPIISAITFIICSIHVFFAIKKILYIKEMNAKIEQSLDTILKILADYSIYPVLDEDTAWRSIIREQIEKKEAYPDVLDAWKIVLWGKDVEHYEDTLNNIETLNKIGLDNIIYDNIKILDGRDKYYGPYVILKENLNGYNLNSYSLYLSTFKKTRSEAKDIIRKALEVKDEITIDLSYLDKWFDKCL